MSHIIILPTDTMTMADGVLDRVVREIVATMGCGHIYPMPWEPEISMPLDKIFVEPNLEE